MESRQGGAERTEKVRRLNDELRTKGTGGRVIVTRGIAGLGEAAVAAILAAVATFDRFDEDNDPWGEHDFGALDVAGRRVFWKIDYYDQSLTAHSPDPADLAVTERVMTVMLAEEY